MAAGDRRQQCSDPGPAFMLTDPSRLARSGRGEGTPRSACPCDLNAQWPALHSGAFRRHPRCLGRGGSWRGERGAAAGELAGAGGRPTGGGRGSSPSHSLACNSLSSAQQGPACAQQFPACTQKCQPLDPIRPEALLPGHTGEQVPPTCQAPTLPLPLPSPGPASSVPLRRRHLRPARALRHRPAWRPHPLPPPAHRLRRH